MATTKTSFSFHFKTVTNQMITDAKRNFQMQFIYVENRVAYLWGSKLGENLSDCQGTNQADICWKARK